MAASRDAGVDVALVSALEAVQDVAGARSATSPEAGSAAALLALVVVGASSSLNLYATQPLLPLLARALGVSPAAAALTISAPSIAVALSAPLAGVLADRLGRRRMIVASLFALAVPTLLAATSGGILELVAWRFAQGLLVPGAFAVAVAYATVEWQEHGVGRATGALITGNVIGGFTGRVVSAAVAGRESWRAAFVALAVLSLAGAIATWRVLPREARRAPKPAARPTSSRAGAAARGLLAAPVLATLGVGFGVLFTISGTFTYVTFHLSDAPFHLDATALSWIFAVYLVGGALTPAAGRWVDRIGSRKAVAIAHGIAIAGACLTLAPSVWWVVVGLTTICTAAFTTNSAAAAHLSSATSSSLRSVASGAYVCSYYLGGAVGAVLPSIAWKIGRWPACLALIGIVQTIAIVGALRFWSRMRSSQQRSLQSP